jgi:hypothetical protein
MFFRNRTPRLPNLTDYLLYVISTDRRSGGATNAGGVFAGIGALTAVALGILELLGALRFLKPAVLLFLLAANFGCWVITLAFWSAHHRKSAPDTADHRYHRVAVETAKAMAFSKRLHKDLNPTAAQLLEEAARYWREIVGTLEDPFWSSSELPSHWRSVRDEALSAATQGMEELLILLRDSYRPSEAAFVWQEAVEDVIESFVNIPRRGRSDYLPIGFEQAREVAEKLKLLAAEVKQSSREVSGDLALSGSYGSGVALELALRDLRGVREAEQELRNTN